LRDRSIVLFLVGATASSVGMFLQAAALGKHLYDITDSELALGVLGLVEFLPALILLPVTGSTADRFDRRHVAAVALAGEVLTSLAFLVYARTGSTSAAPIFVIAAVFGTCRAFASPSVRSIPPLIAPDRGLPRLIAFYTATWQFGLIVGPAASGFLYDAGVWVPYVAAAAGFAIAAVVMPTLTPKRSQARTSSDERPTLHHALEGLRFIRRQPVLLGAIALDLFAVLFAGAVALLPAIAEDRLGVGNVGYGWLRAAPGIGGVLVTGLLAVRPVGRHIGHRLYAAVAVFAVMTIVLGITTNYVVAFVALLVLSGADAISVFIRATIVPLATPDRMRGRVAAVENVFIGASNELGAFESGVAATLFGVSPAVTLGGILTLGVVGIWCVAFPDLRDVDRFSDIEAPENLPADAVRAAPVEGVLD
jgi:MFS family permease